MPFHGLLNKAKENMHTQMMIDIPIYRLLVFSG